MISLAPWYYRNLLGANDILEQPEFFKVKMLTGNEIYEVNVSLKNHLKPSWATHSQVYKNVEGSGASQFKNVATYKAISEALERYAFYYYVEDYSKLGSFDVNPTTTGMAAFPHFFTKYARENAINESIERWAIHEFNLGNLPIKEHFCNVSSLKSYEIVVPFENVHVSLLYMRTQDFSVYGFAADKTFELSFQKSIIELERNYRVLKNQNAFLLPIDDLSYKIDRNLIYFSSKEGSEMFEDLIKKSPRKILSKTPKVLCDLELKGPWSEYTKVWRHVLENSYNHDEKNYKFFMF